MLGRRSPLPEGLLGQAQACAEVASEAARFFRAPSETAAFAVDRAGLKVRRETSAPGRFLARAAAAQADAVCEALRFGVAGDAALADIGRELRECSREFLAALEAWPAGARCEGHLVGAKRRAAFAQGRRGRAQAAALREPNAVLDLKIRTVLRRLETAAEAWQQAADAVAELLGSVTRE